MRPIFKSGGKLLVNNYRPISLLSCLSKILEKLIKSRLLKYFGEHDVVMITSMALEITTQLYMRY